MTQTKKRNKRIHISEILRYDTNDTDTPEDLLPEDIYSTYDQDPIRENDFSFRVSGSPKDREKVLKLLRANLDVFSETLSNLPAKLKPMTMDVNYEAFKGDRRSHEPTRGQTAARKAAIAAWIRQAIADNIIRPSTAEAWSQLMLAKKPNGKWRFAIDYRALNKYTKTMRAPIPNIKKVLHTIGTKQPKFFAKMDLTTGFWQAPMAEESMKFTAFDSDEGLFEFTRASMGLVNSPFYFQSAMEKEVFPHLLHKIMEIFY